MPYCHYTVGSDGKISLTNHSSRKFNVAKQILSSTPSARTVLDAGCAEGAIGIAISQTFSHVHVHLVNADETEAQIVLELLALTTNATFKRTRIQDLSCDDKFDITLWFAIMHHLVSSLGVEKTLELMHKLTNRIAVIEVPLGSDALLDFWIRNSSADTYAAFENVATMTALLSTSFAHVFYHSRIQYDDSPLLNRHVFICETV